MLESWLQPLTRLFYSLLKWAWTHLVASQNDAQLCSSLSHCENTFGAVETIHPLLRKKKRGTSQLGRSWISRKKKQFSSCQYMNDTDPSIRVEIVSWSSWLNLCGETIVVLCTMIVHSGFLFILQKSTINALRKPYQKPGVFLCAVITSFAKNYTSEPFLILDTQQRHRNMLPCGPLSWAYNARTDPRLQRARNKMWMQDI